MSWGEGIHGREGGSGATATVLDRHVFASNATAYDTAWATYGWTPALDGTRASRLEEEVPWASLAARAERPPRLSGRIDEVLRPGNRDRLGRAFLPLDGRLGFSIWGAVGAERVGSEWRVLTHTLLLDAEAFRRVAGHPEGMLHRDGRPRSWFRSLVEEESFERPRILDPWSVRPDDPTGAYEGARLGELRRLRDVLSGGASAWAPAELAGRLAGAYEALGRIHEGGGLRHVALRTAGPDEAADPGGTFLRLVWLSLPAEDRIRTFYVTEQRRTERPRAQLLGLPEAEWGRYEPEGTWRVDGDEPPGSPSAGRRHWAELLCDPDRWDAFVRLDRRAARRGLRLVTGGDLRAVAEQVGWAGRWRARGPTLEAVRELARRELRRGRGPRSRAVGRLLGAAVAAELPESDVDSDLDDLLEAGLTVAGELGGEDRVRVLRGAVRSLREVGQEGRRAGALLRCRAAAGGDPALGRELHRLVDRESDALRALLESGRGLEALVPGAFPLAAAGDPVGRELVRLGVDEGGWDARRARELVRSVDTGHPGVQSALVDVLLTLARRTPNPDTRRSPERTEVRHDRVARGPGERRTSTGADVGEGGAGALVLLEALDPGALPRLLKGLTEHLERHVSSTSAEGLVAVALVRGARAGGPDGHEAALGLLRAMGRVLPPVARPGLWHHILAEAPATWLGRPEVLETLAHTLGAEAGPYGGGDDSASRLAGLLADRILERAGPSAVPEERAEVLLRLVWSEGETREGGALERFVGARPEAAVPVLAQLLVSPAPLPLFYRIRELLVAALDAGTPRRGVEPWSEGLRRYAPGVHGRLETEETNSARVFLVGGEG